jgi:hypothetical protein
VHARVNTGIDSAMVRALLTLAPNSIAITPDAVFEIRAGIKKGSTARKLLYPPPAAAKLLQF